MTSILEHHNFLFISFEQAARGHRLSRVLAAMPEVYWYSCPDNGIKSYNILGETSIQQRWVSRFHYNRYTPNGHLPPPHDFVKPYLPSAKEYYNNIFLNKFLEAKGDELLEDYIVPYCTHALPRDIYRYFPNAKIINIIHDVDEATDRYGVVGLEFPAYVKHFGIVPKDNEYLQYLAKLDAECGGKLKVKDVWADQNHNKPWSEDMRDELMADKRFFFSVQHNARVTTDHPNVLNTNNVRDYALMKKFLYG